MAKERKTMFCIDEDQDMKIFGNPLISVGDIVSIKNTYQGLSGDENFIVTEVKHSFSEGLETSITCRTL